MLLSLLLRLWQWSLFYSFSWPGYLVSEAHMKHTRPVMEKAFQSTEFANDGIICYFALVRQRQGSLPLSG